MKFITNTIFLLSFLMMLLMTGCGDDNDIADNGDDFTGEFQTYELHESADSGISGFVVFEEMTDGATLITIDLNGTESGVEYPAHIHANTVAEGGGVDIPLTNVDGDSGMSETEVSSLNGTPITYQDLIAYDGHVNVHNPDDTSILFAEGDIGGNVLTGESITYELQEASDSGISGQVRFEERNNGNTLSTIELTGTADGFEYEAHIHYNSVADGGGIAFPFNNVDGTTGVSVSNIRAGQTDDNLSYSIILEFDGHVNVHDPDDLSILVAQGNIGANEGENTGNGNENVENGNDTGNDNDDNGSNGDDGY
jgi:hypothetical protein